MSVVDHRDEVERLLRHPDSKTYMYLEQKDTWVLWRNPTWSKNEKYKAVPPEYEEAWQAWCDGECQLYCGPAGWCPLTKEEGIDFTCPPEDYRRRPKDPVTITITAEGEEQEKLFEELKGEGRTLCVDSSSAPSIWRKGATIVNLFLKRKDD